MPWGGGNADGVGPKAAFILPVGLATDALGNLYVASGHANTIRKITPAGVVTTLAGSSLYPGNTDGTGRAARLNDPCGVAVTPSGTVYVADSGNHAIRMITAAGVVTTPAGSGSPGAADGLGQAASFNNPCSLALDGLGHLFVADSGNNLIRKIDLATWAVTTFAGSGAAEEADGQGTAASFNFPFGLACHPGDGHLYVSDQGPDAGSVSTLRRITPEGAVTTLAGSATPGHADGPAASASFNWPMGLACDGQGNLYVADGGNHTLRVLSPSGEVTTLAGQAGTPGSADGQALQACFNAPTGLALGPGGVLYVADKFNNAIRAVRTDAHGQVRVSTLAGRPRVAGHADGPGAQAPSTGRWACASMAMARSIWPTSTISPSAR